MKPVSTTEKRGADLLIQLQTVDVSIIHSLDFQLAFHCAPTMARVKPASLMSFTLARFPSIEQDLEAYRTAFLEQGLEMEVLCLCKTHVAVILYDESALAAWINIPTHQAFLKKYTYSSEDVKTGRAAVSHLRTRFSAHKNESNSCPHEMGLLLGYPLEDVEGFITYGGENAKLCGPWKVYGNEQAAREQFALYEQVTEAYCKMFDTETDIFSVCSKLRRKTEWQKLQ